uniref:Homoserine o-acetyltransferase isoform 4 n=1 Tax=Tetraselmis sp. GSL018 TaxID=582737 RepID=A0A061QYJ5_9CHLO|mmetsp:Transcript_2472/g.5868  ORF Transcript_2472/g.5868 Transcript_2472/m.5868 type:complete len:340 (-) Transcript_2472:795-1814(-)
MLFRPSTSAYRQSVPAGSSSLLPTVLSRHKICANALQDLRGGKSTLNRLHIPGSFPGGRKYASLLPPFQNRETELFQYASGVWFFEQPLVLGGMDLRLRMTVVRLQDRSLWVHSPLALTEECRRGLSMVAGEVSHVVIPSLAPQHWIYASAYRHYFPKAQLWVPPGLMEMGDALSALEAVGITELVRLRDAGPQVLGQSVPRAWAADIDMAMFACPVYAEAAFHLLEHRLLLTSDLCLGASSSGAGEEAAPLQAAWSTVSSLPMRAASVLGRLGSPLAFPIFQANKEEAIRWVAAVAEMDFDVIAPAHMEAPIYNGKRQFIDCFRYVFSWDLGAGDEAL